MAVAEGFEPYPGCRSKARKALYLGKHFTVSHTQTYILVGKCGQNVGTYEHVAPARGQYS